jgi:hypothetical protein
MTHDGLAEQLLCQPAWLLSSVLPTLCHLRAALFHRFALLGDLLSLFRRKHCEDLGVHLSLSEGELGFGLPDFNAQRLEVSGVAGFRCGVQCVPGGAGALHNRSEPFCMLFTDRPNLVALGVGEIAHDLAQAAAHRPTHATSTAEGSTRPASSWPNLLSLGLGLILRRGDIRQRGHEPERDEHSGAEAGCDASKRILCHVSSSD